MSGLGVGVKDLPAVTAAVIAAVMPAMGFDCRSAAAARAHPQVKETVATQPHTSATGGMETQARHALIVEVETGAVLLDKGADERMPPASMSKIMTAYLVFDMLKQGRAKLDDDLPVSERAWRLQGAKMFVPIGGGINNHHPVAGHDYQSGQE